MGRGTLGEVRDVLGILPEVQDGSTNPRDGPGWGCGCSWWTGTGRGTLPEVRHGLWDPQGGP